MRCGRFLALSSLGGRVSGGLLALALASQLTAAPNIYRATSLYRLEKYEKLLAFLEGLDDGPPRLFLYRAEALARLERRAEAVEAFKKLVEKFPDHGDSFDARRKILTLLDQDKNYSAMVEVIQEFRDGDAQGRLPYNRLEADAYFKAGRHQEAIALLEASDESSDQRTLAEILRELDGVEAFLEKHPVPPGDFLAQRRRGLLMEYLNRPELARGHFELALAQRPDDRLCLEHLAEAAEAVEAEEVALESYHRLVELFPGEIKYGSRLGKLLWRMGKREPAREAWRRLLDVPEVDEQRVRLVIRLFLDVQDPVQALEQIRQGRGLLEKERLFLEEEQQAHLMNRDPKSAVAVWVPLLVQVRRPQGEEADPREQILELAGRGGSHQEAALSALEDAMTLYPSFVEYYLLTDELLRQAGRTEEIPALVQRLVEAVSDTPDLLYEHAERFQEQDLHLEASLLYLAARDRLPEDQRWVVSLAAARSLRAQGKIPRAQELLAPFFQAPAEDLPPGLLEEVVELHGRILLEDLGANVRARTHFSTWIPRLAPGDRRVVPWVILAARGAAGAGDLQAAKDALQALLERGNNGRHTAEIHYRLGLLELYAGHLEESRQILRKIAELFPESEVANEALAEVAFLLAHKQAGEEEIRRYLGLRHLVDSRRMQDYQKALGDRDLAEIPFLLRDDYLALEVARLQAAGPPGDELVELLRRAADSEKDGPRVPDFLWGLAEALEGRGRLDEARAVWEEYLVRHPEGLRLEEVRTHLARLERKRREAVAHPGGRGE